MNFAVTDPRTILRRRSFSVAEIGRMFDTGILGEDEKIELIEGDIVVLPFNRIAHERIKNKLGMKTVGCAPDSIVAAIATTLQLADNVLVHPDIAIFSRRVFSEAGDDYFVRPRAADVDLVIEVGETTLEHDRVVKARLYSRFGLREYWVIDAHERVTRVHKQPRDDGWASIVERGPEQTLTIPALPGFSIRLGDIE